MPGERGDSYEGLQARFRPAVLGNLIRFDPLWNRSCRAYNLHARPDGACRDRLGAVQQELVDLDEPGLLLCPAASLHISLASFLFIRAVYAEPKETLWALHGESWLRGLSQLLDRIQPFTVSYQRVVVTDSAVLALAESSRQVNVIRAAVAALRSTYGLDDVQPTTIHTTLFRFQAALKNPARFLRAAERIWIGARFQVQEIVVTREELYPSLLTQDLSRVSLAPFKGASHSGEIDVAR
ncbi:MAG: 2'-5' RNA ligase family protein [Candidatus Dormiibacterota bacterium]